MFRDETNTWKKVHCVRWIFYLAIGGAIGGCVAYVLGDGKFKPVSQVILYEMKEQDRHELALSVKKILSGLDAADAVNLLMLLNSNAALKGQVISTVTNFFRNQLNMAIL